MRQSFFVATSHMKERNIEKKKKMTGKTVSICLLSI